MAVTEAVSIISRALNEGTATIAVNMDLSKAFDSINHQILCSKLGKYGLKNNALNWFVSYLQGRTQKVSYNGSLSPSETISRGVPQGSNLGPLYFFFM
jgi:hypothetical protein